MRRKRHIIATSTAACVIVASLLLVPLVALSYCTDLDGTYMGVGEVRYQVLGDNDLGYANCYHDDNGHELDLGSNYMVGHLDDHDNGTFYVMASAAAYDLHATDCADILLRLYVWNDNDDGCYSYTTQVSDSANPATFMRVNTCTLGGGASDRYAGVRSLYVTGLQGHGSYTTTLWSGYVDGGSTHTKS